VVEVATQGVGVGDAATIAEMAGAGAAQSVRFQRATTACGTPTGAGAVAGTVHRAGEATATAGTSGIAAGAAARHIVGVGAAGAAACNFAETGAALTAPRSRGRSAGSGSACDRTRTPRR